MKTAGIFHSFNPDPSQYGMVAEFTVTDEASGTPEPVPTLGVTVDSEHGIVLDSEPTAGEHTIGVHFADQKLYESFVGHDVHLVRLTPETDEQALMKWMNWMEPDGLQTPAPAEFLGGVNELPAGSTGYFKANLTPGDYAFIAEVPKADEKRMFVKFTVS